MPSISGRWDERYRAEAAPTAPSELLVKFRALLPAGGWALDVACGGGRNSIFLARCGFRVAGVDLSWEALEQGRELAFQNRATVCWLRADLKAFSFPAAAFNVIVCFYYRDPPLYPILRESLAPGGLIIYETYTREQLRFATGPRNPDYLLEPGELLKAFGDWELIFSREVWLDRGVAALVARKPGTADEAK